MFTFAPIWEATMPHFVYLRKHHLHFAVVFSTNTYYQPFNFASYYFFTSLVLSSYLIFDLVNSAS